MAREAGVYREWRDSPAGAAWRADEPRRLTLDLVDRFIAAVTSQIEEDRTATSDAVSARAADVMDQIREQRARSLAARTDQPAPEEDPS